MKVERMKEFMPVHITLETQDEVDALYAVVNFTPICNAIKVISDLHAEFSCSDRYKKYHNKLSESLERWYKKQGL